MDSLTVGILGGGQLAQMLCLQAHNLGLHTLVVSDQEQSCAKSVCTQFVHASWHDIDKIKKFVAQSDVIAFEFENIPQHILDQLPPNKVYNNSHALHVCQNRIREKQLCNQLSIKTAEWVIVENLQHAHSVAEQMDYQCVFKTAMWGYDGKGQISVRRPQDVAQVESLLQHPHGVICEKLVPFDYEISIVVARDTQSKLQFFDPSVNYHVNHVLNQSIVDDSIPHVLVAQAKTYAQMLAQQLQIVGLLAVEMFVVNDQILVNELAPRPHNSAHWSQDACMHSQFDLHLRALACLPLVSPMRTHNVVMQNLVGTNSMQRLLASHSTTQAIPHWYHKNQALEGRKMGHVNCLYDIMQPLYALQGSVNVGF